MAMGCQIVGRVVGCRNFLAGGFHSHRHNQKPLLLSAGRSLSPFGRAVLVWLLACVSTSSLGADCRVRSGVALDFVAQRPYLFPQRLGQPERARAFSSGSPRHVAGHRVLSPPLGFDWPLERCSCLRVEKLAERLLNAPPKCLS